MQAARRRSFDEPVRPRRAECVNEVRLLIRMVPYGGSRRLMLVRDVTRIYNLEQMRKDFVANVSHELRSPLTVIIGLSRGDRPMTTLLPANFRRPVGQMSLQASRMSGIVEDLLQLSRLEATPGAASAEPVAVAGDARARSPGMRGSLERGGASGPSSNRRTRISPCSATGASCTARFRISRSTRCSTHRAGGNHPPAVDAGRESGGALLSVSDTGAGIDADSHSTPHREVLSGRQGPIGRDGRQRAWDSRS